MKLGYLIAACALLWPSALLADTPCLDVSDSQGRKLAGVSVTLANWTRLTDQSGRVCFQNVPPGRYQVLMRSGQLTAPCNVASEEPSTACTMQPR